ncbi:MAG TPA: PadR family transcriptional regulator, partial [Terricaulis sp.]|nr:PadR family transcriptional regulator [Terricaulis sp.]
MFEQGALRTIVLALIAEQPRHGYEIIKEIEHRVGGAYAPSPGVIYPLLTMLEDMGLAELSASDGAKKLY